MSLQIQNSVYDLDIHILVSMINIRTLICDYCIVFAHFYSTALQV